MSVFNDQRYYFVQVHPSCNNDQAETIFVCLQTRFVGEFKMLVSYWLVDSIDYFKMEVKSYAYFE